ncbi:hypothetical protein KUTeg_019224 [Tegillarca granosa]|uniref:TPX2 central domain-containing protein n=1 Tax=Tegillarca granosa TaxID=220873 RepID=A0ABQ9EBX7_TEGGR|nr:hypothetical protein KUTeg_019224 [Tegillarca granosa]
MTRSMCATPNNENNLPEAPEVKTDEQIPKLNNICTSLEEWRHKTANSKSVHGNSKSIKPTTNKKVEEVKAGPLKRQNRSLESSDKPCQKKRIPSISADKSNTAANRNARALRRSVQSQKLRRTSSVGTINTSSIERVARSNLKRTSSVGKMNTSTGKVNTSTGRVNLSENKTQRRSAGRVMSAERSNLQRAHSVGKLNSSTGKLDTPVTNGQSQRRSGGRVLSAERPYRGRSNSNSSDGGPSIKVAKLTLPTTPTCMKRKPMMKPVKPTEEKELEQIAYLRNELAKNRKLAQESYKKAVSATSYMPVQSKKEPTMPQEFHFKTDSRIKTHGMETRQEYKEKDFVANLRHTERAKSPGPVNRTTVPQPFHLTECRKRKMSDNETDSSDKYVSMAQQVTAFHSQTPERFRSSKRRVPEHGTAKTGGLTVPKTPNLETKGRSRPVHIPSREEIEEKELEEMRQQQFKAHPVNSKIMSNPTLGVKKVPPRPLTQFEEFNLESNRRAKEKETKPSDEEKFEFHAQPVPKKILEGVVGVKPPKEHKITVPQSPAFALKHRARLPVEVPEEEEKVRLFFKKSSCSTCWYPIPAKIIT